MPHLRLVASNPAPLIDGAVAQYQVAIVKLNEPANTIPYPRLFRHRMSVEGQEFVAYAECRQKWAYATDRVRFGWRYHKRTDELLIDPMTFLATSALGLPVIRGSRPLLSYYRASFQLALQIIEKAEAEGAC